MRDGFVAGNLEPALKTASGRNGDGSGVRHSSVGFYATLLDLAGATWRLDIMEQMV